MKALRIWDAIGTTISRMSTIIIDSPTDRETSRTCRLEQWPKLPEIRHPFDGDQFVEKGRAFLCAENGDDQIASLGKHFLACHRICRCPTNIVHTSGQLCAIQQDHLKNGHTERHEALKFRVRNELNFCSL